MEIPTLILSIDEGPKKGESFERKPGRNSSIRIGRILRGNNICIKDPSISQNHLIIDFQPHISRWTVTDLGASNGASVNGSIIPPNAAFPLSDGDTVKIGKSTSISVKIAVTSSAPDIVEGKRRTRASAKLEEQMKSVGRNLEDLSVNDGSSRVKPSKLLKRRRNVKDEERQSLEKVEVRNVEKEVSVKEQIKPAKLLKRRRNVKDEERESLEKVEVLVNDRRGRRRGKKEDGELVNKKGKTKGRRGGRSKQISGKGEEDKELVVESSVTGSRKVMFRFEEVENNQSNKEGELMKSWSSFSEIRGIPNTTSKYREDRLINCHATPFEARVERALNRKISETSSSMEA